MQSSNRKTYGSYKLLNMNKNVNGEKRASYLESLRSKPLMEGLSLSSEDIPIPVETDIHEQSNASKICAPTACSREISAEVRKVFSTQNTFSPGIRLTSLNLSFIPTEIANFSKLQTVFLDNNRITDFPAEFYHLTSLGSLFLNSNEISVIPFEFCNKLTSLTYLDLRNNKINSLPSNFGNLCKLREILLFDNKLEDLPLSFGKLTELQSLKLFNNRLYKVPISVSMLRLLSELYLGNNQISEVPEECFSGLHLLRRLDLSGNKISSLPNSTKSLVSLSIINLENNCFEKFPVILFSCTRLVWISIHNNKISSLPTGFAKLPFLLDLWLGKNELNFLNEEICSLLTLTTLTVEDNPLYTDPVLEVLPKGRVRSLLEIAAERVAQLKSAGKISNSQEIPLDLMVYIQSPKLCSRCYDPCFVYQLIVNIKPWKSYSRLPFGQLLCTKCFNKHKIKR